MAKKGNSEWLSSDAVRLMIIEAVEGKEKHYMSVFVERKELKSLVVDIVAEMLKSNPWLMAVKGIIVILLSYAAIRIRDVIFNGA